MLRTLALWIACCLAVTGRASRSVGYELTPAAAEGRQIAQQRCAGCHAMTPWRPGPDRRAPPLWTLFGRQTPDSLAHATMSVPAHDPQAMPSLVLTRDEAAALLAYSAVLSNAPRSAWRDLDVAPCIATLPC